MTIAIAKKETALENFTREELDLIKQTVAKDATDAELKLFLYTAGLRGLNPLTRQIHFVKRKSKQPDGSYREVATIQTGIDGFRLIAERTNRYAPGSKPTIFNYANSRLNSATVFGVKVVSGQAFEFSATAKFSEYAQYKGDGQLTSMWKKMPETMLEKCAEAKLLRRGFPEELSGLYTHDEMAQADNEIVIHEAETPTHTPTQIDEGAESETPEVTSDNPYAHYFAECPEHGDLWFISKYGKRCHKTSEGWCNFNDQIKVILKQRSEQIDMDAYSVNDWCKENYEGRTWSKLTEQEQIDALWAIDQLDKAGNEPSGDNPLVEEAKKLGAKVMDEELPSPIPAKFD